MTQIWSPLAAEPFDLDDRTIAYPTISFFLRTKTLFVFTSSEQNFGNNSPPFWSRRKIRTSVRPEVEIGDSVPLTFSYHERFPIDPENFGFLPSPVPEILWKNKFLFTRAPPGDGVENQKSVWQFRRHPRGTQTHERTSRNSVGKCSVPARYGRKREKNKRDTCKIMD